MSRHSTRRYAYTKPGLTATGGRPLICHWISCQHGFIVLSTAAWIASTDLLHSQEWARGYAHWQLQRTAVAHRLSAPVVILARGILHLAHGSSSSHMHPLNVRRNPFRAFPAVTVLRRPGLGLLVARHSATGTCIPKDRRHLFNICCQVTAGSESQTAWMKM